MRTYTQQFTLSSLAKLFSATSYTDITGFAPFLPAGGFFRIKGYLSYSASATTCGIVVAVSGAFTANAMGITITTQNNANGANTQAVHNAKSIATVSGAGNAATASVQLGILIDGFVDLTTSGSGGIAICAKGTGTAGTATIQAGGRILLEQVL